MPNHVTNRIALSGEDSRIKAMLEAIQTDKFGIGTVDFNKIIPMPETLNIEAGSRTDNGLKAYKDFVEVYTLGGTLNMDKLASIPKESEEIFLRQRTDVKADEWELGKKAWQNLQNYGAPTWYEWAYSNWGTKWNSYGYDENEDYSNNEELSFQTAWSAPHPILKKLSEMFPDITLEHKWADEDIGANCGRYTYLGGERIDEYIPDYGKRSMDFAAEILQADLSDWGLVENSAGTDYINIDCDEYELVELFGKPALFSNERLTASSIPKGLYCYDLRQSDNGESFAALEPHAAVNHGGTVVTDEPLEFGKDGYIALSEETAPDFIGQAVTFQQYMEGDFEQTETGGMTLE